MNAWTQLKVIIDLFVIKYLIYSMYNRVSSVKSHVNRHDMYTENQACHLYIITLVIVLQTHFMIATKYVISLIYSVMYLVTMPILVHNQSLTESFWFAARVVRHWSVELTRQTYKRDCLISDGQHGQCHQDLYPIASQNHPKYHPLFTVNHVNRNHFEISNHWSLLPPSLIKVLIIRVQMHH